MQDNYLTETKVSKSQNGKSKTFTYSTVIPKVIVTKFRLDKGNKLYWDIDNDQIIITPELPESQSIEAGIDILNDFIINGNNHYSTISKQILSELNLKTAEDNPDETKDKLITMYKSLTKGTDREPYYKRVIKYLLGYPLEFYQHEILKGVYNEINKN